MKAQSVTVSAMPFQFMPIALSFGDKIIPEIKRSSGEQTDKGNAGISVRHHVWLIKIKSIYTRGNMIWHVRKKFA
jgi:hypothetical protein